VNNAFYTVEQIAQMLCIHPKTIQRYIREGRLRAAKIGKSWRVSGHDLSLFTEGNETSDSGKAPRTPSRKRVAASCVVDIDVDCKDEAIRIINTLNAAMNVKPSEYGRSSMFTQFMEQDNKVRITLWGSVKFMAVILSDIEAITGNDEERYS
jgi:excisionase family DNA binding protein